MIAGPCRNCGYGWGVGEVTWWRKAVSPDDENFVMEGGVLTYCPKCKERKEAMGLHEYTQKHLNALNETIRYWYSCHEELTGMLGERCKKDVNNGCVFDEEGDEVAAHGTRNCRMCTVFRIPTSPAGSNPCIRCPLFWDSNRANCSGTPYQQWCAYRTRRVDGGLMSRHAAMIEYMERVRDRIEHRLQGKCIGLGQRFRVKLTNDPRHRCVDNNGVKAKPFDVYAYLVQCEWTGDRNKYKGAPSLTCGRLGLKLEGYAYAYYTDGRRSGLDVSAGQWTVQQIRQEFGPYVEIPLSAGEVVPPMYSKNKE